MGIVPYGSVIDGAVGRGDVGIAPYGGATRGAVRCRRADRGVRPYGGLQEVPVCGTMWASSPTESIA